MLNFDKIFKKDNPLEENLKQSLLDSLSKDKWERIGLTRRAGILVPLFSVYSKKSIGIGDFQDLKLLIDWCNKVGLSIIALLPMNELGAIFCPYDSVSSFALEPAYICLENLPHTNIDIIRFQIDRLRKEFSPGVGHVDYEIKKEKIHVLKNIFLKEDLSDLVEFKNFIDENKYWIDDFALYKVLKDYYHGLPWYEWEDKYKNRDALLLENFRDSHYNKIMFEIWIQWQLHRQFKSIKEYASHKKVLIKGDLPILVSRDSSDVWAHPEFFKLEYASGAPQDMYCAKGQRWGMPTYNWDRIAQDNYKYLKEKLKYAQNFYDILRIDHVVGLFRIWSIPHTEPLENAGLNGSFDLPEENKWEEHGRNLLSVIAGSTDMLLCAEDLGTIPQACPKTLKEFGIPGNDVQRWTKDWKVKHDFLSSSEFRFLSVAMLSTHDTTNFSAWWENEVGTIDEGFFVRKCNEKQINYDLIKNKLFDFNRSKHARLRWLDSISSVDIFVNILGKDRNQISDLIETYENTYQEKEKLWKYLNLDGPMQEKSNSNIVAAALNLTLQSDAIFCIELITDWLSLANIFKDDAYEYRINVPGTISKDNWSLTVPISLDEFLRHGISSKIKIMLKSAGRI